MVGLGCPESVGSVHFLFRDDCLIILSNVFLGKGSDRIPIFGGGFASVIETVSRALDTCITRLYLRGTRFWFVAALISGKRVVGKQPLVHGPIRSIVTHILDLSFFEERIPPFTAGVNPTLPLRITF
jgi:hypothetical protein